MGAIHRESSGAVGGSISYAGRMTAKGRLLPAAFEATSVRYRRTLPIPVRPT